MVVSTKNLPEKTTIVRGSSGSFSSDGIGQKPVRNYEGQEGSDLRNRKVPTLPLASVHQPNSAGKGTIAVTDSSVMRLGNVNFGPLVEEEKTASSSSTATTPAAVTPMDDDLDVECLQRFLKLNVKHFTDAEGVVNGVLLVTPNCVMFDPDLNHPLVRENGAEKYGMIAKMDEITSAALYTDVTALVQSQHGEKTVAQDEQQQKDLRESVFYGSGEHSEAKLTPTALQLPDDLPQVAESANRFFLGDKTEEIQEIQENFPTMTTIKSLQTDNRARSFSDSSATGDDNSHNFASTPLTAGPSFIPGSLPDIPELASPQKAPPPMARLVDSPIVTAPQSDGEISRESQKSNLAEAEEQQKLRDLLHLPSPVSHGKRHLSDPGALDSVKVLLSQC